MLLKFFPLKTKVLKKNFNLIKTIKNIFSKQKKRLLDGDILIMSSKIVALSEGRVVRVTDFDKLISKEADRIFEATSNTPLNTKQSARQSLERYPISKTPLTLKDGMLVPFAGIDRSNAPKGYAILWPKNSWACAKRLHKELKKTYRLRQLGILICDSRCTPLRWGTTGLALGWAGFFGIEDARGQKDIFGKPLKITRKAVADNLASAALLLMGEANEKIPFVIASSAPVRFTNIMPKKQAVAVKPSECLFQGIYNANLLQ